MFCEYFKRLPVVVINIEQKITLVLWKPRKCHILLHFFCISCYNDYRNTITCENSSRLMD